MVARTACGSTCCGARRSPNSTSPQRLVLAALIPELSEEVVHLDDPNRLYDAVVQVLASIAERAPLVVLLDDVHWLDEQSLALLHFAVRHLADLDVAFVASARGGELDDNVACGRVVAALRRDDALVDLEVGPLAPGTIAELTEPIAPGADTSSIAAATNGNPLFALEMARALARGDEPLSKIDALIGDRLARPRRARAARSCRGSRRLVAGVPPSVLEQLADADRADLVGPFGDLERHGVLHADDDGSVDFAHDLVRTAAYARCRRRGARCCTPGSRRSSVSRRPRRQPGRRHRAARRRRR